MSHTKEVSKSIKAKTDTVLHALTKTVMRDINADLDLDLMMDELDVLLERERVDIANVRSNQDW